MRGKKTGGRQKGTPNKLTVELKDAILKAAELAGDEQGIVGYLHTIAVAQPQAFLTLLGKVLPKDVTLKADASEAFLNIWSRLSEQAARQVEDGVGPAPD